VGGWTLDAGEAVCGVDLEVLASLIDKSLVVRREQDTGSEPRYGMLETIREYAAERLAESEHTRETYRNHACWYLELAERVYPELRGAESGKWLELLEREHDNLRAALTLLIEKSELEEAVQLAGALSRFWLTHGHLTEGVRRLEEVLSRGGKQQRRVRALRGLAILLMERGDLDRASVVAEDAVALALETNNDHDAARAAGLLGDVAAYRGDLENARKHYEQAAEASRRVADDRELAVNLYNLGHVARLQNDLALADRLFEETHAMFSELDDRVGLAGTTLGLVETAQVRGDREGTHARVIRALELMLDVGYPSGIVDCFNVIAGLAADAGDSMRAARMWGAASALDEQVGRAATHPDDAAAYNVAVAAVRAACGDGRFDEAWAEGKALSIEDAAAYALEGLSTDLSSE
jgi:tetratricopeptide (TPR) repeat protein